MIRKVIVMEIHLRTSPVEFKNDEFCGSRGESRRVEAIFVRLVKKDDD
jgi:hypothetical protein